MNDIQILSHNDIRFDMNDDFGIFDILPGTCPGITIKKCRLSPGCSVLPRVYSRQDKMQIFFFTRPGGGMLRAGNRFFALKEQGVFVPAFDRDPLTITAGHEALEYLHIIGPMTDIDRRQMDRCSFVLPKMTFLSDSIEYTERFTQESGSHVVSHSILAGRHLGRYTMGWNIGAGPDFIGQHTHPTLEQWYFMLDDSDFIYRAGNQNIHVEAGDISFTPHGTSHGSECDSNGYINYVWFELNRAWEDLNGRNGL